MPFPAASSVACLVMKTTAPEGNEAYAFLVHPKRVYAGKKCRRDSPT
jgi:hypothetical protein